MPAHRFAAARDLVAAAARARAFPAAVVDVGRLTGPIWQEAFGSLTYDAGAAPTRPDTWFDLASLTKVMATTPLAMRQAEAGLLSLDAPVGTWLNGWDIEPRRQVRIRHLLDHSSGLPAHAPLWERAKGRSEFERAIGSLPLEHAPGARSVYSDLGFILLGFILEDVARAPLDRQFEPLAALLGEVGFTPPPALFDRIAPTEDDPWRGRVLRGDVHDENAAALGGVAAHAGLFGTAASVAALARLVLRTFDEETPLGTPKLMRRFTARSSVPGSSRALGWDTMLPTSSCGTRMSPSSIGHTGFTGTSLWIDIERDVYVVLLTNRVHPTRANEQLRALRPRFHDAVFDAVAR
jgi:CubicO group peptidase (beta-lactamase class C family)